MAADAPLKGNINMLAAMRCGETQLIMLARTVAPLEHIMKGRLTINIISPDFPGEMAESAFRHRWLRKVVVILRQARAHDEVNDQGEVRDFAGVTTGPAGPCQKNGARSSISEAIRRPRSNSAGGIATPASCCPSRRDGLRDG